MKKRVLTIILIALVIIGIAVSVSTVKLEGLKFKYGLKQYDGDNAVVGCAGDGNECLIVY